MSEHVRTSTRDLDELRDRLATWLSGRLGTPVAVSEVSRPSANGMSSETLFFTASWEGTHERCVARLAPAPEAVPIFPAYDLRTQFDLMRLARRKAGIPAPRPLWFEPDPGPLGTPFFVMDRGGRRGAAGRHALHLRGLAVRRRARRPAQAAGHQRGDPGRAARRPVHPRGAARTRRGRPARARRAQRAYYEWAHGERPVPLLERAFDWLEAHWPDDPGADVLSWGDARIGNVMYRDFTPVAVLDWEMAAVGPRELDLAWMIFLHRFFQDLTVDLGLPGMPDFMRREDVCRTYRELTGHEPRDLRFYEMYAALRHGIVMARVWLRRIHFGELAMPDDPDDLVIHRATLERLLTG